MIRARLAARLFYEHLLDQDCYLDWYLSSMEESSLDAFPIWLAMLNIYWGSLVRFRKRGRRLAEALLEKLREATSSKFKINLQPLIDRVSLLVRRLCRENSPCLILPRSWGRYQDVVASSLADDSWEKAVLQSLVLRNARVQRPGTNCPSRQRSPQEQVIKLLDASRATCDMCALSSSCLALVPDRQELVSVLLRWASSPFRHGLVRVYIAVRLFRKWKRSGMDIDACIFPFLTKTSIEQLTSSLANVYHIIVELIRSQTFSVGRYLQWLVARGAVEQYRQNYSQASPVPVDIALLSHLPVARLPRHLRNLRDTLMARAGLSPSEAEVLQSIKADLKRRLPELLGKDDGKDDFHMNISYDQIELSWSVKADVSQWIRSAVSEHYGNSPAYHPKTYENSVEVSSLTQEEFLLVRSILEQYGDLSMLADILVDASNSDDVRLLTCAVDTLNRHFECFTIIGAMGDLFRSFYEAFLRIKTTGHPLYDLAYSMVEVGHRLPNEANSLVLLRQELSRADRNLALAACSPVSDHMAETLNDASPSFNEDMDHFLSSGNSMDEVTMILVFQKLIQQLAFYSEKQPSMPSSVCRHLVQLRSFNSKHFDLLLVQWLEATLQSTSRPNLSRLLYPLVGIGCVTLPAFATLIKKLLQSGSLQPASSALPDTLVDFLGLLVPNYNAEPLYDFLAYRFRIAQEDFLHGHSHEALALLKDAVPHMTLGTHDLVSSVPCVVPLLSEIVVRHPEDATLDHIRALMKTYPIFLPVARKSLDLLLNGHQSNPDFLTETAITIEKTNHLSLPLCQMKLQILFNEKNDDSIRNSIVDLMYRSAVTDVRAGNTYWLDLVSTMGQEAAEQVRNYEIAINFVASTNRLIATPESRKRLLFCCTIRERSREGL